MQKVLRHEGLGGGGGAGQRKAQAARSEQEGIGTPELEAPFASSEGVK
ncbi:hypothetical protein [Bacillus cereus group sp. BfR-BA-01445]|nr:hypothetical protein [Bacillus cereus group sp. BfR-BA-01445]